MWNFILQYLCSECVYLNWEIVVNTKLNKKATTEWTTRGYYYLMSEGKAFTEEMLALEQT